MTTEYIYKYTALAQRDRGDRPPLTDTSEHYVAASSYEQGRKYVVSKLKRAGWEVLHISAKEVFVEDIRDGDQSD